MNYNRIILVGRLTRDPDLRTTPDGVPLVRCTVAVDRRTSGEQTADFFDFVAFRQQADFLANYATKGRLVLIEGRLQSRSYTDREGIRRKAYEIVAQEVRLLDRPREMEEVEAPAAQAAVSSAGTSSPSRIPPTTGETDEAFEVPDEFLDEGFEDVEGDPFEQM